MQARYNNMCIDGQFLLGEIFSNVILHPFKCLSTKILYLVHVLISL